MNDMLEITLTDSDSFLKIRETLTRCGIANSITKTLWQSCHILHKRGRHFIVHFKELLAMDGRTVDISTEDKERRNDIAKLLEEWGLCTIINPKEFPSDRSNKFRTLSYIDATENGWELKHKYVIGKKKNHIAD